MVLVKPGEVLVFGNVGDCGSEMAEAARALGDIVGVRVVLFTGNIDMTSLKAYMNRLAADGETEG